MSYRERLAINYTFFRYPSHYILVLIPLFTGIIAFLTTEQGFEPRSGNKFELIAAQQLQLIEIYLTTAKLGLIVTLAFFLNYRWAAMVHDGSYGYWLSLGVERRVHALPVHEGRESEARDVEVAQTPLGLLHRLLEHLDPQASPLRVQPVRLIGRRSRRRLHDLSLPFHGLHVRLERFEVVAQRVVFLSGDRVVVGRLATGLDCARTHDE